MTDLSAGAAQPRAYSDVVSVFEPHTKTLPPLGPYLSDLWDRRRFAVELATAEVRGKQASTLMGELWGLLDPIFQGGIFLFLFVVIRGGTSAAKPEYVTMIIANVFLFNYTRIAVGDGGRSITKASGLVLNSIFPRALLPVSVVYKGFLATLPAMAVYAALHLLLGGPIGPGLTVLPLLLVLQTITNLGLVLLLSTAVVFFKDMGNMLGYILRVLTFVTPVIYPAETLTSGLRTVLSLNPLFAIFASYQAIVAGQMPSPGLILQAAFWAAVTLFVGASVFLRHERALALHL